MDDESLELVEEQAYSWLEVHKKSALTFVILSALEKDEMWSKTLTEWIFENTEWNISERALYRVLRRMQKQGSIKFTKKTAARTGAERKIYQLTPEGKLLLDTLRKQISYLKNL